MNRLRSSCRVALAVTCALLLNSCSDSAGPSGPGIDRVEITPESLTLVAGESQTLVARALGATGQPLGARPAFWSSNEPRIATVSQGGVVTGVSSGSTRIAASIGGRSALVDVTVGARPVTLVRVLPGTAQLQVNTTVALRAEPVDASGNVVEGRPVTWSSSNSAVAPVGVTGIVSGVAPGVVTITATVDGVVGTAIVTIQSAPVASVTILPSAGSVVVGGTLPLVAIPRDAQGVSLEGRIVTWSSSNNAVATVSSTGVVSGVAAGSATITATVEGVSAGATLTVQNIPVSGIAISPTDPTIPLSQTVQLTARLTDANGNVLTGRTVTWSTTEARIASVSADGVVTGVATGAARITAVSEGKFATTIVTVTPVPVASVTVTPTTANVSVGGTFQLTGNAFDAAGKPLPGRVFTWQSGAPSLATVDATGLVTGIAPGTGILIFATSEGKTVSATVNVVAATVSSVRVTPNPGSVEQGKSTQLVAAVLDASGSSLAGKSVVWTSSNNAVALVSASGVVSGVVPGTVTITATSDGISGTALLTVVAAAVSSVAVVPNAATVGAGGTLALAVALSDAQGNPISPTGRTIVWSTSNAAVATVSPSGVVSAVAPGTATITAASGTAQGSAQITVTSVAVASVTVAPPSVSLTIGGQQTLAATARDASGNALSGRPVSWTSSNPAAATVAPDGTVTGVATGSTTITATVGGVTGTSSVTVGLVAIASITVTPTSGTLAEKQTLQLTAVPKDAAGNTLSGRTLFWSTSNAAIATVSQTGLVTAVGPGGPVVITVSPAASTAPSASSSLTVTFAPVAAVAISPSPASAQVGGTVTFSATLTHANGQSLTNSGRTITWQSSAPAVASIDASTGVATAIAPGTTTITVSAASPGQAPPLTKSATFTVSIAAVSRIVIGPVAGTLHVGTPYARSLTATAYDANNNPLVGRSVAWSSGDINFATVAPATGTSTTVTGAQSGSVQVIAQSGTVADTIVLTVDLVPVFGVSILPGSATLIPPQTQQLAATPRDSAGNIISGAALGGRPTSWTSSNPSVASVSSPAGLVTAVGVGTASIRATIGSNTSVSPALITVLAAVQSVATAVAPDSVIAGNSTLGSTNGVARVLGSTGPLSGRAVTITSSNPAVATVNPTSATSDPSGEVAFVVTGVSAGTVTITATSAGVSSTPIVVRVLNPVASVGATVAPDSVIGSGSAQVTAVLRDANNVTLVNRVTTFASSNPAVATIDPNTGAVTAVAPGSTTVTATSEGKTGSATFRVLAPVSSVTMAVTSDSVIAGGVLASNATVVLRSSNGTVLSGRPVTFVSRNTAIASVNSTGLIVSGGTPGSTYVVSVSEGKADSVLVRSLTKVSSIAFTFAAGDSIIGNGTLVLTATLRDANGNLVVGRQALITSTSGQIIIVSPTTGVSNASGEISITVTGVAGGSANVQVQSDGVVSQSPPVRVVGAAATVQSVTITPDPATVAPLGSVTLTITLKDANGNPLAGRVISSVTSSQTLVAFPITSPPPSDAAGQTVVSMRGLLPGTVTITAKSEGVTGTSTLRVQ